MWIAKDKNGQVTAFVSKPFRYSYNPKYTKFDNIPFEELDYWDYFNESDTFMTLNKWDITELFDIKEICDNLKWEDEPIELKIIHKPSKEKIKEYATSQNWSIFGHNYDYDSCVLGYECGCEDALNNIIK